jgi:hypothetical protein
VIATGLIGLILTALRAENKQKKTPQTKKRKYIPSFSYCYIFTFCLFIFPYKTTCFAGGHVLLALPIFVVWANIRNLVM